MPRRGPKLGNPISGGLPKGGALPPGALRKLRGKKKRRMGGAL